jgi:hypothetical protein
MSALPPKADIAGQRSDVRFVPIADIPLIPADVSPAFHRKLGNGADNNGPVQAYLADDHWRDADKKWWCTHGKSQWRHSPLATRCIMCGS